jgi:hypothetical protein
MTDPLIFEYFVRAHYEEMRRDRDTHRPVPAHLRRRPRLDLHRLARWGRRDVTFTRVDLAIPAPSLS